MSSPGIEGKTRIYVVNRANRKPTNYNQFTNVTSAFLDWSVRGKIRQIATFEGTVNGMITQQQRALFNVGNFIYVLAGKKLVGKFIIESSPRKWDGSIKIQANQSTGSELANVRLLRSNTLKKNFKKDTINTILNDSQFGILRSRIGNNGAIINSDIDTPNSVASCNLNNHNRIEALNMLCNVAQKEWIITHGTGSNNFTDGDTLVVRDRIGSPSQATTLTLRGNNTNVFLPDGGSSDNRTANHIIVQGTDIHGNQMETFFIDNDDNSTTLILPLDGFLAEDINATQTTIELKPNSFPLLNMRSIWVKIDNEIIRAIARSQTSPSVIWRLENCQRGMPEPGKTARTTPAPHKEGSDVCLLHDDSTDIGMATGQNSNPMTGHFRVWYTPATSSVFTNIRIGSEDISTVSRIGTGVVRGTQGGFSWVLCTRSSTSVSVATPGGTFVASGKNTWSLPEIYAHSSQVNIKTATGDLGSVVGTSNSIHRNGLYTKTFVENGTSTKDDLDRKALQLFKARGNYQTSIELTAIRAVDMWNSFNLGDNVLLTEQGLGVNAPLTTVNMIRDLYRVVEFKYSFPNNLTLCLNHKDTIVFVDGFDSAFESYEEETEEDIQDPVSVSDLARTIRGEDRLFNINKGISFGPVKHEDVVLDKTTWGNLEPPGLPDDNDAATVGWVRALTGQTDPVDPQPLVNYWKEEEVGGETVLKPYEPRRILPFSTSIGNALGSSANKWHHGWFTFGRFQGGAPSGEATLTAWSTGNGDSFRAGRRSSVGPVDPENWNFRVGGSFVGIYNGPFGFNWRNPGAETNKALLFFEYPNAQNNAAGGYIGFRRTNRVLEFMDETTNFQWRSLSTSEDAWVMDNSFAIGPFLHSGDRRVRVPGLYTQKSVEAFEAGALSGIGGPHVFSVIPGWNKSGGGVFIRSRRLIFSGEGSADDPGGIMGLGAGSNEGIQFNSRSSNSTQFNSVKMYGGDEGSAGTAPFVFRATGVIRNFSFNKDISLEWFDNILTKRTHKLVFNPFNPNDWNKTYIYSNVNGHLTFRDDFVNREVTLSELLAPTTAGSWQAVTVDNRSAIQPINNVDVVPRALVSHNLGARIRRWNTLFVNGIDMNGPINMNRRNISAVDKIFFDAGGWTHELDHAGSVFWIKSAGSIILQNNSSSGAFIFRYNQSGSSNRTVRPHATNTVDLGTTSERWRDLHVHRVRFSNNTVQTTTAATNSGNTKIFIGADGPRIFISPFSPSGAAVGDIWIRNI